LAQQNEVDSSQVMYRKSRVFVPLTAKRGGTILFTVIKLLISKLTARSGIVGLFRGALKVW
jgi:hypothetical protein